ncbi:tRNA uridine-5-carboxymethylaminomethyl(34) synthesis GTPase MnmE [Cellulophaga sp. BC115SP]|uniref:tRNA uridine-5-carboxymethylaminomethyl(34) synthesis GTPase MnmE n=1 Tax=Cellulophaga sp. BC115SP TaxID=2683263 RepID=UPI00141293D9|nr:tRNA uridine-5-carboxymethylaminomethyl(34) synthesis GTPase MnmE [Cellulophaga sp. BC115SP]NBB27225.1 tRNA uridine-5-carboxymethylaminomethyl(34) synthesis GTPase MnmE [Cellulophaga sp. BC115SP]
MNQDTICALATAQGVGAIGVIRVSGPQTIDVVQKIFKGKNLHQQPSHTIHFGTIRDDQNLIVDEVLISLFKAPTSYTKEDTIEISCHGSDYIIQKILKLLLKNGARLANPGEFTQRAFLNGQLDLAQAEAVADLIASDSEASHQTAINQIRGGFSKQIAQLRESLIHFASLIELELDFGEEDVEFADRDDLRQLIHRIQSVLVPLIDSFEMGNVIKNGVPTVIVGKPNAGKSTLLNRLLNEEKAIVSDIAGTTRDVIEDELFIEGIRFRLIDTAGLRKTNDTIEAIGVERTLQQMEKASMIIYLFDASEISLAEIEEQIQSFNAPYVLVGNKQDKLSVHQKQEFEKAYPVIIWISASENQNIESLQKTLVQKVKTKEIKAGDTVVTNLRHYQHLLQTSESLNHVLEGLSNSITGDFLAQDIRFALHHLGEITGQITTDDLLANIFSKFCIGK